MKKLVTGHWALVTARGQSTLEYILVLAAVLAAVIVGAGAMVKPAVTKAMGDSQDTMQSATGKLKTGLGL